MAVKIKTDVIVHLLTAFVLFLKGFDKLSQHSFYSGTTLLLLGAIILALVAFGEKLHLAHSKVKWICLLIETVALSIMAVIFHQEGKQYLQYVFALCALTYLIIAIVLYRKGKSASGH